MNDDRIFSTRSIQMRKKTAVRRGAAAILILFMLAVFVTLAAITIDYSYMQLVRTELRAAADSAAKAGAEALGRTQDVTTARQEAIRYAAANSVGPDVFQFRKSR